MNSLTSFTPVSALLGGALIGLSALLLMRANGKIAGISGIVTQLAKRSSGWGWRLSFIAGLILAPLLATLFSPELKPNWPQTPPLIWIISAICVGAGTVLGSGCTSGHGICGLARLSKRSIAATLTFMAVAALTVFVRRHVGI